MVFDSIINFSQLPWFIFILLILSYFMWAKFLNKGKLNLENNVNSVLDIFSIFFFVLITLIGLVVLIVIIPNLILSNINFTELGKILSFMVSFLGIGVFLYFLMSYRNKNPNHVDLEKIFRKIIKLYLIIFALILGAYLLIQFFPYKVFIKSNFMILISSLILILGLGWSIITNSLFGKIFEDLIQDKKSLVVFMLMVLAGVLISLFFVPLIFDGEFEAKEYVIYNPGDYSKDYIYGEVPISIFSLGQGISLIPVIPLNIEGYGINVSEFWESNEFKVVFNTSNGEKNLLNSYSDIKGESYLYSTIKGIRNIQIKEEVIGIIYDLKEIKKEKVNKIFMYGVINYNLSKEEFDYSDDAQYINSCFGNGCKININIKNNLDLPVRLKRDTFVNLNNRNVSFPNNCSFDKISVSYMFNKEDILKYKQEECHQQNHCEITIGKDEGNKSFEVFKTYFNIDGNGVIDRSHTFLNVPMEIDLTLTLNC